MTNSNARPFDLALSVASLERTPRVLRAWLDGLDARWTATNYGAETFSPFDVVGHLLHGEHSDWIPRMQRILAHGQGLPFDPYDRFAQYEESRGKSLEQLLGEFERARAHSLAALARVAPGERELDALGMHPRLGTVTLRQLLATWVVHDLNHLHQIAKCMAWQYRDEVGPWREYLPLLPRAGGSA